MRLLRILKWTGFLLIVVGGLGMLVWYRATTAEVRAVSVEDVERQEGMAVAVQRPVRRDFIDYLHCDAELGALRRYGVRANIAEVVEEVLVDIGETVVKEQLLVRFRKTDLQAQIDARQAAAEEARANYRRYKSLLEKGVVSEDVVEARRTALQSAEALLRSARSQLQFAEVRSPAGEGPESSVQVAGRWVDPGEYMNEGQRLLSLVDLSRIEVRARVPGSAVRHVSVGEPLQFRLEGQQRWRSASVTRISPSTDHPNRFFDVYAAVDNRPEGGEWLLRPGMYAEVRIERGSVQDALAVRGEAVLWRGSDTFVFVVARDEEGGPEETGANPGARGADAAAPRARRVKVETGLRSGGCIQLKGDAVSPDDLVISAPRYDMRDGQKIRITDGPSEPTGEAEQR